MLNERSTFALNFIISRTRKNRKGECPVLLNIRINGAQTRFPIKRHILPEHWDADRKKMRGRTKEAKLFNAYLDGLMMRLHRHYNDLLVECDEVTPKMLKDAVLGINEGRPKGLLALWDSHNERLEALVGIETSASNLQKYRTCRNHFACFLEKEYQMDEISIKRLNHKMIEDFEFYLKVSRKCSHNTTIKFLQNLKKITNDALKNGDLKRDPFARKPLSLKVVKRPYLTEEELFRLMRLNLRNDRLVRVRDFFIFACYTGLSYADVKKLKREEIVVQGDVRWIKTFRQKTNESVNIPLLDMAWEVIVRQSPYFDRLQNDDPVLEVLSNQKMNSYLKELSDLARINKVLSYHTARHTFATTITLQNGVPIESVSKMLGHKSIRSTQHYARIVDKKLEQDMSVLATKINGGHQMGASSNH